MSVKDASATLSLFYVLHFQTYEDEPLSELDPSLADDVDLLNEDTFGSGALGISN